MNSKDEKRMSDAKRESDNMLWHSYLACVDDLFSGKRSPGNISRELRKMISKEISLPLSKIRSSDHDAQNRRLASFYNVLGLCFSEMGRNKHAIDAFENSVRLDNTNAHYYENFIEFLVSRGNTSKAIKVINSMSLRLIESEQHSTAARILEWSCKYHRIALKVSPLTLKQCIILLSKYGKGIQVG